jgi:hypothetical protein
MKGSLRGANDSCHERKGGGSDWEWRKPQFHAAAIGLGALDYHAPAAPVSVTPPCGAERE